MKSLTDPLRRLFSQRKVVVDLLIITFGLGSWVSINGLYTQLPLLVREAPESWSLPSYMTIAVQLGNVGPAIYVVLHTFFPKRINDKYYIYALMSLTCLSCLLTSFFYNNVTMVNGQPRSIVFLVLLFVSANYGCTSSVLSYPYLKIFKDLYIPSYFIGEGLSNFLPSMVSLIQGVNTSPVCGNSTEIVEEEALFGTMEFALFLFALMLLSIFAFLLINKLKVCKKEMLTSEGSKKISSAEDLDEIKTDDRVASDPIDLNSVLLQILNFATCAFGYGIYPSITSYSALPYGYKAYHLVVIMNGVAFPLGFTLAYLIPRVSNVGLIILAGCKVVVTSYVLMTAIQSPSPILVDSEAGLVLIVIAWALCIGLFCYIRSILCVIFRNKGGSWMLYSGVVTQLGAGSGTLLIFFLINYGHVFEESDPCQ